MPLNTDLPTTAARCDEAITELLRSDPTVRSQLLGTTAFGRPLRSLILGRGPRRVLFSGAHHANEWITATVLLAFAYALSDAQQTGGVLFGTSIPALLEQVTFYLIPMVDPDGVDLVTGALAPGDLSYDLASRLAREYPGIPFPNGWKANLLGVDLNLQYPAGWLRAREIKFSQGYRRPGPRDYVGRAPLNQLESRALADYTLRVDPALVVALHTQGQEIYWQYGSLEPPGARELGEKLAAASGYRLAQVPYESGFAGYKDWFIQEFRRPGYTVEAGLGTNPLPLSQFPQIYQAVAPLLIVAAVG